MGEHARLSPSSSKRWFACPGSVPLNDEIPDQPNSYSDAGTAQHEVSAICLTSDRDPEEWLGAEVEVHDKGQPRRAVRMTQDHIDDINQYVNSFVALREGHEWFVEQRVEFGEAIGVPGQFGTGDGVILRKDGELQVHDAKFGRTQVEVIANPQLMFYALGFYYRFELSHDIKSIRLFIHQPKLYSGPIEWACTVEELLEFQDKARDKAVWVEEATEGYRVIPISTWNEWYLNPNPNEEECAFCKAMATCPSYTAAVQNVTGAAFPDLRPPINPPTFLGTHEDDNKELAHKMDLVGLVEDWCTAVRAETERRLLAGIEVEGWGLELGRQGNRKFANETEAEEYLRKKVRLTIEEAYDMSLKSASQILKMTEAKKPKKGEEAVKPRIGPRHAEALAKMITRSEPKPSVKPAADITEPYKPSTLNGDAFGAVPNEEEPLG